MKKLISIVAEDLIKGGWENLADYVVVLPMQRAALYLKEEIKNAMQVQSYSDPVRLPQMTTITQLSDSLCPLHTEEEIFSVCRLYSIYRKHTDALLVEGMHREPMSLDVFYNWGRQLLTDFSNVDMALLDADALFENTAAARSFEHMPFDDETRERLMSLLGHTEFDAEEDSIRFYVESLWSVLPQIYRNFSSQLLEEKKAGLPGARARYVVEHFEECAEPLRGKKIVFVGFNYLLGAERKLMELCRAQCDTRFYWDIPDSFSTNEGAYKFIRENITRYHFENSMPAFEESYPRPIVAVASQSAAAQAQYAHDWLLTHHRPGDKTAIVIADEAMLEQVVYAMPIEWSDQINITKGFPLRNTRIYSEVARWLSDSSHDVHTGETYTDVLTRLLSDVLSKAEYTQQNTDEENRTTWQHALIQESLYQTRKVITRFRSLLGSELRSYITSLKALRNVLCRHLEGISLPFHGEPVTDIQIIGMLETRLLDFDHLLILNVEEGVLPSAPKDNSFIPFYLRKFYHMQTQDEEALIYAYNFFRLTRRCKDVTLVFTAAGEGNNQHAMSRFLMQILTSPDEFRVEKRLIQEPMGIHDFQMGELCDTEHTRLLRTTLSPSAINTYVECPLRFYLSYMRDIKETRTEGIMFESNQMGNLVHATLLGVYNEVCGVDKRKDSTPFTIHSEMLEPYLDECNPALEKMLQWGYEHEKLEHMAEHPLENHVILEQVRKVLKRDQQQARSLLEIVMLEQDHRVNVPVMMLDGDIRDITVGGMIDRLDIILENGVRTLRVLDYKTGTYSSKKQEAISLDRVLKDASCGRYINQTMIYSMVCAESGDLNPENLPVMPQLLFTQAEDADMHVRVGSGPKTSKIPVVDFAQQYLQSYKPLLMNTIAEMYGRSYEHSEELKCPEEKCSSYCPFHILCGREKKEY